MGDWILGAVDTTASLRILRPRTGETFSRSILRTPLAVSPVAASPLGSGAGYLRIATFAAPVAKPLREALRDLPLAGGLALDLRGNAGGSLREARLAGTYIATALARAAAPGGGRLPLAIIVDGATASAAESLTLRLRSTAGARVLGDRAPRTAGKAEEQEGFELSDGSGVVLTTGSWRKLPFAGVEVDEVYH